MATILILAGGVILLAVVLSCEKDERRKGLLASKTTLSFLFVLVGFLGPHPHPAYSRFLIAGLGLCLVGDVCLALPGKKAFLAGLVAFLLGHIFYFLAFLRLADPGAWTWLGSPVIVGLSAIVYWWLRPHLGAMNGPVIAYVVVITFMVAGALSMADNPALPGTARAMIVLGALAFYFSDIFVARDRFLKKEFVNRLVGLPLYYAGQFLLAFSTGF